MSDFSPKYRIGVDVGGTFTDLVTVGVEDGAVHVAKVPSTPENQAHGVLAALDAALGEAGAAFDEVQAISHGTTVTTNALLERKIARCGLITTRGFRDVLELGRRTRPNPYGMIGAFEPLIPRDRRLEVPERLDAGGNVVTPLDEAAVRAAVAALRANACEALVIHFLHSYRNPVHELRARDVAAATWPEVHITMGHAVISEYREYERGVTAAANAAVQPVLARYLGRLQAELADRGFTRDLLVMQGNGGSVAAGMAAERAVTSVMSGPATGVMAAAATARDLGLTRIITYDMGGTSTDVGLALDGVPQVTAELELEYAMPVHVPMVDVHTIGAGGGSIAHVDDAGILQVGPQSAGAMPGPICYGRGGDRVTITDANLLLGRLDPERLLAVDSPVTAAQVRALIGEQIGAPLGLDAEAAAAAVIHIANTRMAGAIRMVSLARGHDPRDFALFTFGGAGPMHGAALARELGIPIVLVPARPGIANAIGCVAADLRHDFVRTVNTLLADIAIADVRAVLEAQIADGRDMIDRQGVTVRDITIKHTAEMQFQGQTHMRAVPVSGPDVTLADLQASFDKAYRDRFAVELPEIRAVLVNLHTAVIGRRQGIDLARLAGDAPAATLAEAQRTTRRVWFPAGWQEAPVYRRERLPRDAHLEGPAIVEQLDCTTVLEPGDRATVDAMGNLMIEVAA